MTSANSDLRYGGKLLASHEYTPFNYRKSQSSLKLYLRLLLKPLVVVYLAVVQGSISAGQTLSFGPSTNALSPRFLSCTYFT